MNLSDFGGEGITDPSDVIQFYRDLGQEVIDWFMPPAYAPEARPGLPDGPYGVPIPPVYTLPRFLPDPPRTPLPLPPKWEPPPSPVVREPIAAPKLPPRRIKADPVTRTTDRPGVTIQQSLSDRQFGCLLHVPISDACIVIDLCTGDFSAEELQKKQDEGFIRWLTSSVGIDSGVVDTIETIADLTEKIADVAVIFLPPPYKVVAKVASEVAGKINTVFGLGNVIDFFTGASSQSQNVSGLSAISTVPKCIKYNECKTPAPVSAKATEIFAPKPEVIDECFVPIRNFKSNEPDGIGYKTELQIIFANYRGETAKRISVPDPKTNLVKEDIINALVEGTGKDTQVYFGLLKVECNITTYGYIRHYTGTKEEGDKLLTSLARLSNGNVVEHSLRASDRFRELKAGWYQAYRAYIIEFNNNGGKVICRKFKLR
ncbi:MAG: hypothetical protein KME17_08200 [Cyanosarcina radialis HA8281-LM2]|jgi:hypothetical protein|nr:hypothetical protein [Cyanosarcina radialis HA8281-LM2]